MKIGWLIPEATQTYLWSPPGTLIIGSYQEKKTFVTTVVMGVRLNFIATTPYDWFYNSSSVMPKIVPLDNITVLVDTKDAVL